MPKIPAFIKQTLAEFKETLEELKELKASLTDLSTYAAQGKKCADAKRFHGVDCYEFIYGKDYVKAKK